MASDGEDEKPEGEAGYVLQKWYTCELCRA